MITAGSTAGPAAGPCCSRSARNEVEAHANTASPSPFIPNVNTVLYRSGERPDHREVRWARGRMAVYVMSFPLVRVYGRCPLG